MAKRRFTVFCMRVIKYMGWSFAWLAALVCAIWAFGALYFDFPKAGPFAAILFVIALLAIVIFVRGKLLKLGIVFGACALVVWWLTLKPSNDRAWQPDVAQTAWAEINGDEVTIHDVRNCDYRTATDFTTHYETRTVRLSQITGMDLAINYWGSPWIAHPIVSFQFSDGLPLCFSIETRKTLDSSTPRWKVFIGSTRSSTLWRMSAIAFVYALTIDAKMFIFTTRWLPQLKRARDFANT